MLATNIHLNRLKWGTIYVIKCYLAIIRNLASNHKKPPRNSNAYCHENKYPEKVLWSVYQHCGDMYNQTMEDSFFRGWSKRK